MLSLLVRAIVLILPLLLISSQIQTTFGLFEGLFVTGSPCLSKKDTVSKGGFSVYDNKDHKVQIQYPSDWIKNEDNIKVGQEGSSLYSLATFQPNTAEGFKSALELEITEIANNPGDLKSLTGLADSEKENVLLSPEARILSSGETQINGCPAYEILYSQGFPDKPDQWKIIETILVDCNKEYMMRFTATESGLYDKYLESIRNMIQTFKIGGC
jgi:PsbP-like protein